MPAELPSTEQIFTESSRLVPLYYFSSAVMFAPAKRSTCWNELVKRYKLVHIEESLSEKSLKSDNKR